MYITGMYNHRRLKKPHKQLDRKQKPAQILQGVHSWHYLLEGNLEKKKH